MIHNLTRASRRIVTVVPLIRAHRITTVFPVRSFSATQDSAPTPEKPQIIPDDRFEGVGQPFGKEIASILSQPIDDTAVILEKGGSLKVSDEYYKDILNKAFGVGGWALVPCGEIKDLDLSEQDKEKQFISLIREYSLYCHERFVSQAFGETSFYPGKQYYSEATEKIKVSALSRCCKDLGIANELWNKRWSDGWKTRNGVQEWVENISNNKKSLSWRLKDEAWSWPFQKTTSNNNFKKSY